MTKKLLATLLLTCGLALTAFAQSLPDYYQGIREIGTVDDVGNGFLVIDDGAYRLADEVIVHSTVSYSVSFARVRPGKLIGFNVTSNRVITEIWLLPDNYRKRNRRPRVTQ